MSDNFVDSEFIKEMNTADLSFVPPFLIAFIKRGIVLAQNNMWKEGGTERTGWDVCTGCYRADWEGHEPGCEVEKYINDAHALLKKLEMIEKQEN